MLKRTILSLLATNFLFISICSCTAKKAGSAGDASLASQVASALSTDLKSRLQTDGIPAADIAAVVSNINTAASGSGVAINRSGARLRAQASAGTSVQVDAFVTSAAAVADAVSASTDLTLTQSAQIIAELGASGAYVLSARFPSTSATIDADQQTIVTTEFALFSAAGISSDTVIGNLAVISQSLMTGQLAGSQSSDQTNSAAKNFSAALPFALSVAGVTSAQIQTGVANFVQGLCSAAGSAKMTSGDVSAFQTNVVTGITFAAASLTGVSSSANTFSAYLNTAKTGIVAGLGSAADNTAIAQGITAGAAQAQISSTVTSAAQQNVSTFDPTQSQAASFQAEPPKTTPTVSPKGTNGFVTLSADYEDGANVIVLRAIGDAKCVTSTCALVVTFTDPTGATLAQVTYTSQDVAAGTAVIPLAVMVATKFSMNIAETLDDNRTVTFSVRGAILSSEAPALTGPSAPPGQGGGDYHAGTVQGVPTPPPTVLPSTSGSGSIVFTSVSPSSGADTGGTAITITGSGFVQGLLVVLGGAPCLKVVVSSDTTATCTTGPHGAEQVAIMLGAGSSQTFAPKAFTYATSGSGSIGTGPTPTPTPLAQGTTFGTGWTPFAGTLSLAAHDAANVEGSDTQGGLFGCSAYSPSGDYYVVSTKNALEINPALYQQAAILHIRRHGTTSFDPLLTQGIVNNLGPCNIYFDAGNVYVIGETMGLSMIYTKTETAIFDTVSFRGMYSWSYYDSAPACDPSNYQVVAYQNTFMTKTVTGFHMYFGYQEFNFVVGGGQGISVTFDYNHQVNGTWADDGPHFPASSLFQMTSGMQGAYQNGDDVLLVATNLFRSTDNGRTFTHVVNSDPDFEPTIASAQNPSDGSILFASAPSGGGIVIWGTRDYGATITKLYKFSNAKPARAVMAATQNAVYLFTTEVTATLNAGGSLWDNDSRIVVAHSSDEGLTWSTPTALIDVRNLSNTGASFNTIGAFHASSTDGRISLVYGIVNGPYWGPRPNYGTFFKEYY